MLLAPVATEKGGSEEHWEGLNVKVFETFYLSFLTGFYHNQRAGIKRYFYVTTASIAKELRTLVPQTLR